MIQRIQSVFLVVTAILMGLLFLDSLSFVTIGFGDLSSLQGNENTMLSDAQFDVRDHVLLLGLVLVSMVLAVVILFLFKNRRSQLKLARFLMISIVLVILLSILLFYMDFKLLAPGTEVNVEYGYLLPIGALICTILAMRFIRKDEELVRSADRLR
ncbi:MAG: DUF4293 domain-containing protein [Saprospiraceae bacterium]|nr:DUF4293 domain-containing protein [Saprospiraceae bacterium]